MTKYSNVSINGRVFRVRAGDVLLDGALANGVDIPHDCRAGTCGSCMVRVAKGQTVCGETHTQGLVHACQARVVSDLDVEIEDVPEIDTIRARLAGIRKLAPDVFELTIAPESGVTYIPGQYFRFAFNGFPARAYSPTASLDGRIGGRVIRLNVKRVRGGRVSGALGTAIRPGHRLRLEGPFGQAFLRPEGTGRLILAGSGTGFAPVWAIACMALREYRNRPIVMIAGARRLSALYMVPALARLTDLPNVTIIPTIEKGPSPNPAVRIGGIEAHLPPLNASDTVYACGSPRMVDAVARFVDGSGATFYADPFESAGPAVPAGLLGMLKTLVQARRSPPQHGEDRRAEREQQPYRDESTGGPDGSPAVAIRAPRIACPPDIRATRAAPPPDIWTAPAEEQDRGPPVVRGQAASAPDRNAGPGPRIDDFGSRGHTAADPPVRAAMTSRTTGGRRVARASSPPMLSKNPAGWPTRRRPLHSAPSSAVKSDLPTAFDLPDSHPRHLAHNKSIPHRGGSN
jgi:NAD(P)H-flavin reductase/ferredoxin